MFNFIKTEITRYVLCTYNIIFKFKCGLEIANRDIDWIFQKWAM